MFRKSSDQMARVLIVESHPGNIKAAREILQGYPFYLDFALDARAAAKKLDSSRYDCLVVNPDALMGSGLRLEQMLTAAGPNAAFAVLCRSQRSGLPSDLTDVSQVTFLDIEVLRSPCLPEKIEECIEIARALKEGEVDAILVPNVRKPLALLTPGADALYRDLVEGLQEGIVTVNEECDILFTNRRVGEMLNCDPDSLLGASILSLVDEADSGEFRNIIHQALNGAATHCELALAYPGQPRVNVLVSLSRLDSEDGGAIAVCLALTDLSEEKRLRDALQELVIRDALTGLYNRRYLDEALDREWRRARRYGHPLSCLMLDVDNFKLCNESYGHLGGDRVLREVAGLIRYSVRDTDVVARYGGDEFCVILPETSSKAALIMAERIRYVIASESLLIEGQLISVTVSIGAAGIDEVLDLNPETIVAAADAALGSAKASGKDRVLS